MRLQMTTFLVVVLLAALALTIADDQASADANRTANQQNYCSGKVLGSYGKLANNMTAWGSRYAEQTTLGNNSCLTLNVPAPAAYETRHIISNYFTRGEFIGQIQYHIYPGRAWVTVKNRAERAKSQRAQVLWNLEYGTVMTSFRTPRFLRGLQPKQVNKWTLAPLAFTSSAGRRP